MIKIPNLDYRIGQSKVGFQVRVCQREIELAMTKTEVDNLTDEELVEYVSDCITHEYIHFLLYHLIPDRGITMFLFEGVSHHFCNLVLDLKAMHHVDGQTPWCVAIMTLGFETLLEHYGITQKDIQQAFLLSQCR